MQQTRIIILPSPQPLQNRRHPSKIANTLASLVKGEVLLPGQAEPTMVGIARHPHHQ